MNVSPDTIREDTGLQPVLDRLGSFVSSERAARRIDSLEFARSLEEIRYRLGLAAELQNCIRYDDPIPFQAPADISGPVERSRPEGAALQPEEFLAIRDMARTARLCRSYFESRCERYPVMSAELSTLSVPSDVETAIESVFDTDGNVRDSASSELQQIRKSLQRIRSRLRSAIMRLLSRATSDGFAADDQPTIRGGRMVIPIRAEAKRKIPGFIQDVSTTGQTVYIEPAECLDQNNEIREFEAAEKREIERIRRVLTDTVRQNSASLQIAHDVLTDFEVRRAIAVLANELDAVVPMFNDVGVLKICEGRNPELVLHFRKAYPDRVVVPLNLELGSEFNTLIISGPNAGGKSIALKTVGVFQLMLALGIPVPVDEKSSFPFFSTIFVDIGDSQSVEDDLSTYTSHLARLKEMLCSVDENSLILIDEAGTGTDPDEGSALFQAVLEKLSETDARIVVTTHHGSLKVFAHESDGAANGSMIFDQKSLKPTFRYQSGQPGSSYAPEMAQLAGLPASVLSRARALLGEERADVSSFLSMLQSKIEFLENETNRARTARKEADMATRTMTDRIERLQSERDRIRSRAIREAENVVKDANRTIERVVREIRESGAEKKITKQARESVAQLRTVLHRAGERLGKKRKDGILSLAQDALQDTDFRPVLSSRDTRQSLSDLDGAATRDDAKSGGILTVGDRVCLDGGTTIGEISTLRGEMATVLFGSAKLRVQASRLRRVSGPVQQHVSIRHNRTASGLPAITQAKSRVDVRGMRVAEAVMEVTSLVDQALVAGLQSVEVLHGKGTGALRRAIQEQMASRSDVVKWEDAHPDQGGSGVTQIWLVD